MGKKKFDKYYLLSFITAFLIFAVCILPSLIMTGGVWIYYGDFNVQQIPFYMHVHDAIRSGNFFYDWGTDIGGSLIGCYSFYLLGSPFFWLTIPFPTSWIPYIMPWLSALKYAVMALTAYAFIKRHVKSPIYAYIGALLYSFSGYQGAVLVYNHFHDVMAFFPLYLMLFENMFPFESVDDSNVTVVSTKKHPGKAKILGFTFMTTLMLIINYYFFVGEVVFLVLFYVARYCFDRDIRFVDKIKGFLRALISGTAGVLMAGVYIYPAVYYTLGNERLSKTLSGYDMVAYSEPTMLWTIIKNVVMLPDVSGLNSFLNQGYSRVSGIGGYIPLFSVSCVIAFFLYYKKRKWEKRVMGTCIVFAIIPVLNSLFSAFNSEYYARWYYMPILLMAMMTAQVLEERTKALGEIKKGVKVVITVTAVITVLSLLPTKNDQGKWIVLGSLKNYEQLISEISFCAVMIVLLLIYIYKLINKKEIVLQWFVIGACIATTVTMLITGTLLVDGERKTDFKKQALAGSTPLTDDSGFYRIETDEDFYNYPLIWEGSHCITSFISTIPDSTLKFYDALSVGRKVTSNLYSTRIGMRAVLSAKYYLKNSLHSIERIGRIEDMNELLDYSISGSNKGFDIYENDNYIPMGFTFDYYITELDYESGDFTNTAKDRLLVRALILNQEEAARYDGLLTHLDTANLKTTSLETFERACEARRKTACTTFETSTNGFVATTTLDRDNLVFFSVPYEDGFTAYVDGEETRIIKADYGFMCVKVPKGTHTIEFKYTLSNLKEGFYMTCIGLTIVFIMLVVIAFVTERKANLERKQEADA